MAITQIDAQGLIGWNVIIGGAVAWNGVPAFLKAACLDPLPYAAGRRPTVAPDGSPRNPCPPALAAEGQVRPRQRQGRGRPAAGRELRRPDLGQLLGGDGLGRRVVEPDGRCSAASARWRTRSTAQGGKLTIGFGSKAGVGRGPFESGLQLTLTPHNGGTNVDLAWRTGRRPARSRTSWTSRSPSPSPRR